ncbi:hypothetical protein IFM61392_09451 [Aspergillus lentulus]|uniref:Uncharacterized protein n=1 Tax=Aspergillus lentulus TaxID=293939 RepID=A0AAN5YS99_ASPLE|nr:hypothetical protein CNMCM6069_000508 [Aspergillus lentulus]KAF4172967.1 hypothetical protein CNMCM8060_000708 [Aspergillus lentulus]KAF4185645.1 hypothetical protein CNMCM7927_006463 [Aspergillus lentulus]KAF4190874.1 hypothetical protein CNMCM8694_002828 [Aspergillus lentulus]KAF4206922.1 hypothetical protein CNMCM8927_004257 [Aspergillus lentulus]
MKTRNRLLYGLRKRVREEFDEEQAVPDIERQLAGTAIAGNEAKEQLQIEEDEVMATDPSLPLAPSHSPYEIVLQKAGGDIRIAEKPLLRASNAMDIPRDSTIGVSSSLTATRVCYDPSKACI